MSLDEVLGAWGTLRKKEKFFGLSGFVREEIEENDLEYIKRAYLIFFSSKFLMELEYDNNKQKSTYQRM